MRKISMLDQEMKKIGFQKITYVLERECLFLYSPNHKEWKNAGKQKNKALAFFSKVTHRVLDRVCFNCNVGSLDSEYLSRESCRKECSEKIFVRRVRSVSGSQRQVTVNYKAYKRNKQRKLKIPKMKEKPEKGTDLQGAWVPCGGGTQLSVVQLRFSSFWFQMKSLQFCSCFWLAVHVDT